MPVNIRPIVCIVLIAIGVGWGWSMIASAPSPAPSTTCCPSSHACNRSTAITHGEGPRDLAVIASYQQPGQRSPFQDYTKFPAVAGGHYYLDVATCRFCAWQVSVWKR